MNPVSAHLKVRQIFESKIYDWAQLQSPKIPVSFENNQIDPETQKTMLQVVVVPMVTRSRTLSGDHAQCSGVVQVNVVVPLLDGVGTAMDIASDLVDLFPIYSLLPELVTPPAEPEFKVMVMSHPEIMVGVQTNTKYTLPVSIRYRTDIN